MEIAGARVALCWVTQRCIFFFTMTGRAKHLKVAVKMFGSNELCCFRSARVSLH
jgi:hypothetical protein